MSGWWCEKCQDSHLEDCPIARSAGGGEVKLSWTSEMLRGKTVETRAGTAVASFPCSECGREVVARFSTGGESLRHRASGVSCECGATFSVELTPIPNH